MLLLLLFVLLYNNNAIPGITMVAVWMYSIILNNTFGHVSISYTTIFHMLERPLEKDKQ